MQFYYDSLPVHVFYIPCITILFSNLFCNAFINRVLNSVFNNPRITWNSRNTLLSVAKDVYLNNRSKTTYYTQKYLLNCFIVCLLYNSPNKASGLLFIFVRVSTDHARFSNDEIRISWVPMRPSTVFFSCRMPEKLTRKAGLEVCGWPLRSVFNLEKKTTFEQKFTYM